MMTFLLQLSENDKRLIFAILLIVILLFVIIGYIGMLITKIMKSQGKKLDDLVADVVTTRVITTKKDFKKYARKKNWRYFEKQAVIPIIIMAFGVLVLVIHNLVTRNFSYNVFDYQKDGFSTILFVWDFGKIVTFKDNFMLLQWPPLVNTPHFEASAWASYIFVPCIFIGGIWYLVVLQCLISRTLRIRKLTKSIFEKDLETFNQNKQMNNMMAYNNIPPQQNNNNTDYYQ